METKTQIESKTISFFESLMEKTGTYYLSDYTQYFPD